MRIAPSGVRSLRFRSCRRLEAYGLAAGPVHLQPRRDPRPQLALGDALGQDVVRSRLERLRALPVGIDPP
jgi:hypothetical protein